MEKQLSSVTKHYEILIEKININETALTVLCEELKEIKTHIEMIQEEQENFDSSFKHYEKMSLKQEKH